MADTKWVTGYQAAMLSPGLDSAGCATAHGLHGLSMVICNKTGRFSRKLSRFWKLSFGEASLSARLRRPYRGLRRLCRLPASPGPAAPG